MLMIQRMGLRRISKLMPAPNPFPKRHKTAIGGKVVKKHNPRKSSQPDG